MDDFGSLKRKRKTESGHEAGFTNAGFSSTPKRIIEARRRNKSKEKQDNKENDYNFTANPFLEVKSIAELLNKRNNESSNPYEVVRKPPKKKKRDTELENVCFENPALNLELPEKQFNPFEVTREDLISKGTEKESCFVNEALNLRGQDVPATRNPFEVERKDLEVPAKSKGIENLAISNDLPQPTSLRLALPFQPSLGYRIDFKDTPLSELTPSKLMFEKLAFSPVPKPPKRSLDAISEESSSMSIGKELDRYQLELENSINEAKFRGTAAAEGSQEPKTPNLKVHVAIEEQTTTTIKKTLTVINEDEEECKPKTDLEIEIPTISKTETKCEIFESKLNELKGANFEDEVGDTVSKDVEYASDSEHEDELEDFKQPPRFVRAFRRDNDPKLPAATSKESINSQKSSKSTNFEQNGKQMSNMKHLIRKSIRKLMHPLHSNEHHNTNTNTNDKEESESEKNEKNDMKSSPIKSVLSSIRHSLRRKPSRKLLENENSMTMKAADVSIVDTSERTMKLKTSIQQTEYMKIEQLTQEKKHFLPSAVRSSMRAVFHNKKKEEYAFGK